MVGLVLGAGAVAGGAREVQLDAQRRAGADGRTGDAGRQYGHAEDRQHLHADRPEHDPGNSKMLQTFEEQYHDRRAAVADKRFWTAGSRWAQWLFDNNQRWTWPGRSLGDMLK